MKEQQPLVWSDESPTETGLYWVRGADTCLALQIVAVDEWSNGLCVTWLGSNHVLPIADVTECLWAGPLTPPSDKPQEQEWVRLADLRPGAIFETQGGERAVKRWSGRLYEDNHKVEATSLESGTYMLFHCSDIELVREIAIG